ncbi:MAG: PASTA domain-containing protein, partial [Erysipelotrichaceae bacterium]|nr:PASTA domain-containing protein [Erysipelotrichaceae bacterium]
FDLKGDADEFTRGTTLNITVSKGLAPAGTVQVQDFLKKQYYEAESWARQNKVEIVKNEAFSSTVEAGQIMSQYPSSGTMKTGEVFSVTVSKGKGVTVPDFSNMKENDLTSWEKKNNILLIREERYSESTKHVISQSPAAGTTVGSDTPVTVVINKGNGFYMDEVGLSSITSFNKFIDKMYELRELGLDVYAGQWNSPDGVYSYDHPKGEIVSITCSDYSSGENIACEYKLPIDARFDLTVSKGIMFDVDLSDVKEGGRYDTAKLSDKLNGLEKNNNYVTYFVKTDEDTCDLYVNGSRVTGDTVHLVEGDSVELR